MIFIEKLLSATTLPFNLNKSDIKRIIGGENKMEEGGERAKNHNLDEDGRERKRERGRKVRWIVSRETRLAGKLGTRVAVVVRLSNEEGFSVLTKKQKQMRREYIAGNDGEKGG